MPNTKPKIMQKKAQPHPDSAFNSDYIMCCFALLIMGFFFYGPRVLLLAGTGWLAALLTDRVCIFLRGRKYDQTENSSSAIAFLITMLMPASVPLYVLVFAVICGVLIGKQVFGGTNYPFNPVAIGYAVAVVSWPKEIFSFPLPINWVNIVGAKPGFANLINIFSFKDAIFSNGASASIQAGILPRYHLFDMFLGNAPSPLGAGSVAVLLSCLVFLFYKKRVSADVIAAFSASLFIISFFWPRAPWGVNDLAPWVNWQTRLVSCGYEFLCNTTVFAIVFLICEPKTLPKTTRSRIAYGVVLAVSTAVFRVFGVYQIGICFAVLLANALSGFFDRMFAKPVFAGAAAGKGVFKR